MTNFKVFANGLLKENPTFVMLLGMCPSLAITTMAVNGLGMGLATTFVLICSNLAISLLKKVIPPAVRLPAFITIIAGFVTFVSLLLKAYVPSLYSSLGLFLSLITVNCIILGRAEVFASKNSPAASICDGAGMGLGFTCAITIIGSIREFMGMGSIFGVRLVPESVPSMIIFILPTGGFFTLAVLIALINHIQNVRADKAGVSPRESKEHNCEGCKHCG